MWRKIPSKRRRIFGVVVCGVSLVMIFVSLRIGGKARGQSTTKTQRGEEPRRVFEGRGIMSKKDYESNVVLENQKFRVVGTRPVRHDGVDKVTGRALYGADFTMAGLLHGRVLRSPHAHGVIRGIKFSKALQMPGVEAVITAADLADPGDRIADLGEGAIKLHDLSSNCLARGKVLYKGQAVAAVAATNPHVAEEALKLIEVD